jgi:hypothetical protein
METKFQTSFIPKKPILMQGSNISVSRSINIFSILATILFIVALLSVGAVSAYKFYVNDSIAKIKIALEQKKASLELDLVRELVGLDGRFSASKQILNDHVAFSKLLSALDGATLKSVRFLELKFNTQSGKPSIEIKGEARNYSTVAAQAESFNNMKEISSPVFSGLDLDEKGNVKFSMQANLNMKELSYSGDEILTPSAPVPLEGDASQP